MHCHAPREESVAAGSCGLQPPQPAACAVTLGLPFLPEHLFPCKEAYTQRARAAAGAVASERKKSSAQYSHMSVRWWPVSSAALDGNVFVTRYRRMALCHFFFRLLVYHPFPWYKGNAVSSPQCRDRVVKELSCRKPWHSRALFHKSIT